MPSDREFQEGQRIRVIKPCSRGCCIDTLFYGHIVGPAKLYNGERQKACWQVRSDSGHLFEHVWAGDIEVMP